MKMVVNREKEALRHRLLTRLLALTESELKRRSKNVENRLAEIPVYKNAKKIMAYYPLRGEVDVLEMIRKDQESKVFCFPVMDVKAKNLRIFEVKNFEKDFVTGPLGVKEPDTTKTREVDIGEIDMIIVPGLGFDLDKNRLGRGAGFYDRFLEKIPLSVAKVGIAFEFQVLDNLPINLPSDQKVDILVSENTII
ncbi:MAG: 5-formyltetrahydrofolate cyclo-ligase [Candidatus Omnitrophota bacterium]|jgi:5-formyltetrahydrofolate cyclo-ligase